MTAQCYERLLHEGEKFGMACEPLEPYLKSLKKKRPKFMFQNTACWRGYVGSWLIEDEKLYLTRLEGYVRDTGQIGIDFLFPGQSRVYAAWFTGEIRIPQGDLLTYVHGGYLSTYERDIFLAFYKGRLINTRVEKNVPGPDIYAEAWSGLPDKAEWFKPKKGPQGFVQWLKTIFCRKRKAKPE